MKRRSWTAALLAIVGVAIAAAAGAAALPDNPYQRWQLIEDTLYANATWGYERMHFDARPIDVAIVGASRSQLGLSAPRIAARLAALGTPLDVANLSVVEDGRNLEWALVDELFRTKRPRILIVTVDETVHRWGHPGFKYVAPAAAVVAPPVPWLHNAPTDLAYLPYRQLKLFAASIAPRLFGLRDGFDPARFAVKPDDYTVSRTLADGKRIDMDRSVPADDLRAERLAFAASRKGSGLPAAISRRTDVDDPVYIDAVARLAAAHGARILFVFLPEFDGATTIAARPFYTARGAIEDYGDLSRDADLFQSFSHLNRRGAMIASDRLAAAVARLVEHDRAAGAAAHPTAG